MSKDSPTFDEKFSMKLLEMKIRALLLGGVACNIYGSTRYSQDVDWWIDPTGGIARWVDSILDILRDIPDRVAAIRLRDRTTIAVFDAVSPPATQRALLETVSEDGILRLEGPDGKVDVFHAPNNLNDFEAAWSRSKPWDENIRVLCIQDLIETKRGTGRSKDTDDIRFLETLDGKI